MFSLSCTAGQARVLALVPSPRYAGCAVLDGWGLHAFEGWDLRGRHGAAASPEIARRVEQSIRLYRPTMLAVGVPERDARSLEALRTAARNAAEERGITVAAVKVAEAWQLIRGVRPG